MQPLLNIAVTAARLAGELIVRHQDQVEHLKVTEKGSTDFRSEVDVKAEQAIIRTIHKAYPEHGILAEESGLQQGDADTVWIIDPLDGTSNYLHGFPFFAVSIAVRIKGRIEHGVVYDPVRHECFSATRGSGARLNDRRLRVSKQTQLAASMVAVSAHAHSPAAEALMRQCGSLRRTGSAALDLAYLASGRLDGLWALGLQPWDVAAGSLLIQEAGGLISDLQGGEDFVRHGNVVAGTPKVFKSLLQTLGSASQ